MIRQLHYTSAPAGGGPSGFRFVSLSPDLDPAVPAQVRPLAVYQPPPGLPARPDEEQLALFPPTLSHTLLHDGSAVLCNITYIGRDHTGRYGNFYAHAVQLSPGDPALDGRLPIETWRSLFWSRAWDGNATPTEQDRIAPGEAITLERAAVFAARHADRVAPFLADLHSVLRGPDGGQVVLVEPDVDAAALWIAVACYSLPDAEAHRLTFTTYARDPAALPHRIVAVASAAGLDHPAARGRRLLVHDANRPPRDQATVSDEWAAVAALLWTGGRSDLFTRASRSRADIGIAAAPEDGPDPLVDHAGWLSAFALTYGLPAGAAGIRAAARWARAHGVDTPGRFRLRLAEAVADHAADAPPLLLLDLCRTLAPEGPGEIRDRLLAACLALLPGPLDGTDAEQAFVTALIGAESIGADESADGEELLTAQAVERLDDFLVEPAADRCARAAESAPVPTLLRLLRIVDRLDPGGELVRIDARPAPIVDAMLTAQAPEDIAAFIRTTRYDGIRHGVLDVLERMLVDAERAEALECLRGPAGWHFAAMDTARWPVLAAVVEELCRPKGGEGDSGDESLKEVHRFKHLSLRLMSTAGLDAATSCALALRTVWGTRLLDVREAYAVLDELLDHPELFESVLPLSVRTVVEAPTSDERRSAAMRMLEDYRGRLGPNDAYALRLSSAVSAAALSAAAPDDTPWLALIELMRRPEPTPRVLRREATEVLVERLLDVGRLIRIGASDDRILRGLLERRDVETLIAYRSRAAEVLPTLFRERPDVFAWYFRTWNDSQEAPPGSLWEGLRGHLLDEVLRPAARTLSRSARREVLEHLRWSGDEGPDWVRAWELWQASLGGGRARRIVAGLPKRGERAADE
jgi:hypothetical protein